MTVVRRRGRRERCRSAATAGADRSTAAWTKTANGRFRWASCQANGPAEAVSPQLRRRSRAWIRCSRSIASVGRDLFSASLGPQTFRTTLRLGSRCWPTARRDWHRRRHRLGPIANAMPESASASRSLRRRRSLAAVVIDQLRRVRRSGVWRGLAASEPVCWHRCCRRPRALHACRRRRVAVLVVTATVAAADSLRHGGTAANRWRCACRPAVK